MMCKMRAQANRCASYTTPVANKKKLNLFLFALKSTKRMHPRYFGHLIFRRLSHFIIGSGFVLNFEKRSGFAF